MAISTNQKPTIYRNLYENMGPDVNGRQILTSTDGQILTSMYGLHTERFKKCIMAVDPEHMYSNKAERAN